MKWRDFTIMIVNNNNKGRDLHKNDKIIVFLLGIYVFMVFTFGSKSNTTFIGEVVFIFLASIMLLKILKTKIISLSAFIQIPFTLCLIYGSLYAKNVDFSLSIVTTYCILLVFIFLLTSTIRNRKMLEYAILYIMIGCVGFIIYTFYYYGFDGIINAITKSRRIGYEISQPNSVGEVASICATMLIFYMMFYKVRGISKVLYVIGILASIMVCFATQSRRSLLLVVLCFVFFILFKRGNLNRKIISVFVVSVAIYIMFSFIPKTSILISRIDSLISFVSSDGGGLNTSDLVRRQLMSQGIEVFMEKPLIGHGTGSFRFLFENVILQGEISSHNNFIELLVNHGVIGFSAYYIPIIYTMFLLYKIAREANDPLGVIILTLYFSNVFVSGMATDTYYYKYPTILFAFALIYISIMSHERRNKSNEDSLYLWKT